MRYFQIFILSYFILLAIPTTAQELLLSEIDVKWKFKPNPEDRLSYTLGTKYRTTYYDSGNFDYNTNFLELKATPTFSISSNQAVSLEIRYRVKELFDSELIDEKRISQQYSHQHKLNNVKIKGRLGVEQRFRKTFNLRNRYRLGASFAINKNPEPLKQWLFTAETEALWSVSFQKSPTFNQRFTVVLEKPLSKVFALKLKPQYRHLDYTHNARSNWRFYSTLSISL